MQGDVGNVAFPCGAVIGSDGDTVFLYYGAADTSVAVATGSIKQMLHWLDEHGGPVMVPEPLPAPLRPDYSLRGRPSPYPQQPR